MPVPLTIDTRTEFVMRGVRYEVTNVNAGSVHYRVKTATRMPYRTTRAIFNGMVSAGIIALVG